MSESIPEEVVAIFRAMTGCLDISDRDDLLKRALDEQEHPSKALLIKLLPGRAQSMSVVQAPWESTPVITRNRDTLTWWMAISSHLYLAYT